ncbi:MAG: STAS domain-containing protein [Phycisphaerae bacterium]|nr:STAS domain-containing protein [Phycisphaerae bacterium]
MAEEASLRVEEHEHVIVVRFPDDSSSEAAAIENTERELNVLVDNLGRRNMVLDFSEVRFFSSRSIGVLIQLRKKADLAQAQIVLSAARPELQRVFHITRLEKLFQFFDSTADAIAALQR